MANESQLKRFVRQHTQCITENKALVLHAAQGGGGKVEHLVAPLWGQRRGEKDRIPIFGVYATTAIAGQFLLDNVLQRRRLPVVFDLDETLLKAFSASQLEKAIAREEVPRLKSMILENNAMSADEKAAGLAEVASL